MIGVSFAYKDYFMKSRILNKTGAFPSYRIDYPKGHDFIGDLKALETRVLYSGKTGNVNVFLTAVLRLRTYYRVLIFRPVLQSPSEFLYFGQKDKHFKEFKTKAAANKLIYELSIGQKRLSGRVSLKGIKPHARDKIPGQLNKYGSSYDLPAQMKRNIIHAYNFAVANKINAAKVNRMEIHFNFAEKTGIVIKKESDWGRPGTRKSYFWWE